jgi:hypothetical protein
MITELDVSGQLSKTGKSIAQPVAQAEIRNRDLNMRNSCLRIGRTLTVNCEKT